MPAAGDVNRRGRVLLFAHQYDWDNVSEAWTAYQLVKAIRGQGRRAFVFSGTQNVPYAYGAARVKSLTSAQSTPMWPINYAEFAVRSACLAGTIRTKVAIVQHISPISTRIPSLAGLGRLPFIWGPVGGSIPFPPGFDSYAQSVNLVNVLRRLDGPRMRFDPLMIATLAKADRIVTTTSMAGDLIPDSHKGKVRVVPEGVSADLIHAEPAPEEPYIFSSGRLLPYKALDLAIRAFGQIRCEGSLRLIVTGSGPQRDSLQGLIDSLGLASRVELRGSVSREENRQLMGRSVCCVFPALREAFGHVNLEAMGAWKPVVATDWGGPRDIIVDGVTGLKVLGRDPQEHVSMLAAALQRLVDDRQLRQRMGAAAVRRVSEEYLWPGLGARYDALYRELGA